MHERVENSSLSRRLSRRVFNRGLAEAGVGVGLVGLAVATGGLAWKLRPDKQERLIGKNIEGSSLEEYVTDWAGDFDQVILRSSPEQGDDQIVGYTKSGNHFWAQPEYGVTYVSDPPQLGDFKVGNDRYGHWYRGAGLPVYDELKMNDGKTTLVPRLDEQGNQIKSGTVHVAGNFLIKAPQASSK